MDTIGLYDFLYRLASYDAGDELFGTNAPLAHEAFKRSLAGTSMSTVWFEIPLSGSPRFDLHVAYANGALHREAPFESGAADGHGALLNWYASEPREGGGLALAYDTGEGRIDDPAVHINVKDTGTFDAEGFFANVDRADATMLYDGFSSHLPRGWQVWYFGVHPGRPGTPVRVDYFVDDDLKRAYATDPARLGEDLRAVGFTDVGAQTLRIGGEIATSPYALELQFDVLPDGTLGQNVGLSAGFPFEPASKARLHWESDGSAARLMEFAEKLGVADGRWRRIEDALFTTAVPDGSNMLAAYCVPTFVKFRMHAGEPLDAKVYLQAGANAL